RGRIDRRKRRAEKSSLWPAGAPACPGTDRSARDLCLGGGLRAFWQRWHDCEPEPDEERERLGRNRQIALESFTLSAQEIEPADECRFAAIRVVWGEEREDGRFRDQGS